MATQIEKAAEEYADGHRLTGIDERKICITDFLAGASAQSEIDREAIALSREVLGIITDYPKDDLQGWIEEGKPITITIPSKTFKTALAALKLTENT